MVQTSRSYAQLCTSALDGGCVNEAFIGNLFSFLAMLLVNRLLSLLRCHFIDFEHSAEPALACEILANG